MKIFEKGTRQTGQRKWRTKLLDSRKWVDLTEPEFEMYDGPLWRVCFLIQEKWQHCCTCKENWNGQLQDNKIVQLFQDTALEKSGNGRVERSGQSLEINWKHTLEACGQIRWEMWSNQRTKNWAKISQ